MTTSAPILAVWGFGGGELLIILIILLVLFGGSKLPSLARGLGQSIKEFKKAQHEDDPATPTDPKAAEAKKTEPSDKSGAN
jgi:sec-independent protein translocase protein TatA